MSVSSAAHEEHNPYLSGHFQTEEQETEACTMGMWLFLVQEVMFFGGMFAAYGVYRYLYHDAWLEGSRSLNWVLGGFNTVFLLLSSFTAAMAVYHAQTGNNRKVGWFMVYTLILGAIFLFIKWTFEWPPKFEFGVVPGTLWGPDAHHYPGLAAFHNQGALQIFFFLYFVMTGMHALHMLIGFGVIIWLIWLAWGKEHFDSRRYLKVEFFGLYWHFVDIVWVFLFPMFYLVT
jgi:cytochrome c oxidase subunit 3